MLFFSSNVFFQQKFSRNDFSAIFNSNYKKYFFRIKAPGKMEYYFSNISIQFWYKMISQLKITRPKNSIESKINNYHEIREQSDKCRHSIVKANECSMSQVNEKRTNNNMHEEKKIFSFLQKKESFISKMNWKQQWKCYVPWSIHEMCERSRRGWIKTQYSKMKMRKKKNNNKWNNIISS